MDKLFVFPYFQTLVNQIKLRIYSLGEFCMSFLLLKAFENGDGIQLTVTNPFTGKVHTWKYTALSHTKNGALYSLYGVSNRISK